MSITMTIDIPALDRLCSWLESGDRYRLLGEVRDDIVDKLKTAAVDGSLEKAAKAPEAQTAQGKESRALPAHEMTENATQEPPKPEPTEKPTAPAAPAPATAAVTLDAVQRAAAQMRDDGKLKAVTDMFPEFGIKKLSDLKGDQLQTFGERLRAMGAKI